MNPASLTPEELDQTFRALNSAAIDAELTNQLQQIIHKLQVHQCELEMQNQALRETRAELEQSVHRYADLYDCLPIGYVTLTAQGQIMEANLTAAEQLHCDRAQLPGSNFKRFFDEADRLRLAAHLDECVQKSESTLDATLRPPNNLPVAVQFCSRVASPTPDRAPLIRTAITDVSKLKESHKMLEEVNREQEAFAYSISHDLRSPLVTIISFADLLNTDQGSKLDDTGRDMLFRIRRAARRMDQVLQNLLQYSRLCRSEIHPEPVDVAAVVREVISQHQGLITEHAAQIHVQPPLPRVLGSPELLSQALSNLLTNALKYRAPDRAPVVRISARVQDDQVILKVADEGIGIAPEYHERIFKIFERLHSQTAYPGTGVGLALVQRAVERMNGRVWVESAPGQGSQFNIALPKP